MSEESRDAAAELAATEWLTLSVPSWAQLKRLLGIARGTYEWDDEAAVHRLIELIERGKRKQQPKGWPHATSLLDAPHWYVRKSGVWLDMELTPDQLKAFRQLLMRGALGGGNSRLAMELLIQLEPEGPKPADMSTKVPDTTPLGSAIRRRQRARRRAKEISIQCHPSDGQLLERVLRLGAEALAGSPASTDDAVHAANWVLDHPNRWDFPHSALFTLGLYALQKVEPEAYEGARRVVGWMRALSAGELTESLTNYDDPLASLEPPPVPERPPVPQTGPNW